MKSRILILILSALCLSSCIVKSIQPFYVTNQLKYNKSLVGEWQDEKNSLWQIVSFKDTWEAENNENSKLSKEDIEAYENYKKGYLMTYTKSEKEAGFIAMPFMVDNHLFIDVTPIEFESEDINPLAAAHLLKTHSTAYVVFKADKSVELKWLSESVMSRLFEDQKLRLKHETSGFDEDLILTASSEELHEFLRKFMTITIENKWDKDDVYTLKPIDAAP